MIEILYNDPSYALLSTDYVAILKDRSTLYFVKGNSTITDYVTTDQ